MNRFDSAFSSSQRSSLLWARFVLMAFLLTIGSLSYVTAQSINRASPAGNLNQACEGQQITYNTENLGVGGGVSYTWNVVGGFFVTSPNNPSVTVQWQNQGNQQLSITRNNFGTVTGTTINVAVSRTPTPAVGGPNVVCINTEHTYSTPAVPGSNYVWNITPVGNWVNIGGAPPGANFINVRWIQTGNATVSVTETAIGGVCSATASATVIVNPIPTPNVQSGTGYGNPSTRRPGIVCANSTHSYLVGATPGNVFQWTVTGGTILSGQNTSAITVQWGNSGVGTVACRETVPGSVCQTTDLDSINIRPVPLPSITGNTSPCSNLQHDYTTALVTGNSYSWSVVGGSFTQVAANTIRVNWAAPVWPNTNNGVVQVTESVIDVLPASCNATMGTSTIVRPVPPTPVISGPATVCATDLTNNPATNNTVTYTSSVPTQTAGSGSISYAWTVTGGTITSGQGTSSITVQWDNPSQFSQATGSISLKHTSSFGCENTGALAVTINPLPEPKVVGANVACQNTVENYSTIGNPQNTYSWTITGGNFIRAGQGTPNVAVEWTLPGAASLTVAETNSVGCTVLNTMNVTVNALPNATLSVSGPTTFCPTGDITICAPIGYTKYVWNTGETARCIVARTSGQYSCIVTNSNGCSNSSDVVTLNVLSGPQPVIALSGPTTFCDGGSVVLTAPAGFGAYSWSTGETTQSITAVKSGNYTVTVADNNGCTGTSAEVDVTVNPTPKPELSVTGNVNFCAGDSVVVTAPAGYASYAWTSTAGNSYGTERTIVIKATDTVTCQVVDIFGCAGASASVGVKTPPVVKPVVTAVGSTTFCTGGSVKLVANDGFNSYVWSNGANGKEVTVSESGDYYVTVIDKATNCPVASTKVTIVVNNAPEKPMISREGDVLTAKTSATNVTGWAWSRNGAEIVGADQNQYKVSLPGVYTATVKVPGCTSTSNEFEVVFTGVNEDVVAGETVMSVYPNPTSGRVTLNTTLALTGAVRIDVTNALGERVLSINEVASGAAFATSFDMASLSAGVYNVAVTSGSDTWVVSVVRQ